MDEKVFYIKGGMLIDPEGERIYPADLLIEKGKIGKIIPVQDASLTGNHLREKGKQEERKVPEGAKVLHADGLMIAPGLADTHVHFRDPGFTYKEDIETGAAAAKKGGFTQIVLMANTKPCVDNEQTLAYVLDKGRSTGIHIHSCVNVSKQMKGKELVDMELLAERGAAGFTDDGIPLMDETLAREAMERAGRLGKPISFHEENPELITNNGIHAGEASRHYGIKGSPREAEISLVERDLKLAEGTGAEIVIQHISTKETVELLRGAKKKGLRAHGEATPHHFTLTQQAVIEKGTLAKMNPPLREEADRLAIIAGLADGTVDVIATDHAPHSTEEKKRPITEAPSGIIGLETALSLGIRELVDKGYLTLPQLIYRMSTAPCRLYGLDGGVLKEGAAADLVLFDPGERWTVKEFASKSSNSPFVGEEMPGVVYYTICGGKIVYRKEERTLRQVPGELV
ncbi:MAG: dihydroorotase [Bacillota bacterium]|nr:dihydroorotase [Bacillota bacterium]